MADRGDRADKESREKQLRREAGRILRKTLQSTGESPTELSRRLGVSHTTVFRWIDSKRPPDLSRIQELASKLESPDLRRIGEQILELYGIPRSTGLTAAQTEQVRTALADIECTISRIREIIEENPSDS